MKAEIHFFLNENGDIEGNTKGAILDIATILIAFARQGSRELNTLLLAAGAQLNDMEDEYSQRAAQGIAELMAKRVLDSTLT